MSAVRHMRALMLASASVAALWLGQVEAQAADLAPQPAEPPPPVIERGTISLTAMGYAFWQADKGYGLPAPLGSIDPLVGLGGGLGVTYQPALSPWSFGVNARYGQTKTKKKDIATSTITISPSNFHGSRQGSHFMLDFTVGRDMGLGLTPAGDPMLQLQGGLRFAHLQDKTTVTGSTGGTSFGFVGKRSFTGFGPRLGLAASMPLGASFSIDGTAGVSLLYGRSTEKVVATSGGATTFSGKKSKNAWVPGVDGSLAIAYAFNPSAKLSVGYRVESYFNAYSASTGFGVPGITRDKDFIIHGPYAEAKFKF